MNNFSESEARIRHLEEFLMHVMADLRGLNDAVGQIRQDQNLTRSPFGSGGAQKAAVPAISTSIVAAKTGEYTLGTGTATLRPLVEDGPGIANGDDVDVYSNFLAAVPNGTNLMLAYSGVPGKYFLVAADCPTA
jgi:hypothetical protein